jgi:unsaturated chondroitin disaccharide hydrolase
MEEMMKQNEVWISQAIDKIREKIDWVSDKNKDRVPYTTDKLGNYDNHSDVEALENRFGEGLAWWTNGFWGGLMWLLYLDTKDEKYLDYQQRLETKLEQCLVDYYGLHHDVGFMYHITAVANYRFTGNERSRRTGLHAANLLAGRFNPAGNFIRAWNRYEKDGKMLDNTGWAIIDSLMNLPLLYWASKEIGDPRYYHVAVKHADKTMESFVRPDGSVNHIVEFDRNSGEVITSYGGQGYGEGSSWSRGHGWALYGFALSYRYTGDGKYLDTAKKIAHYCISNINEDGIVRCDFRQPATPVVEDSCGAAIIASGLLEIAEHVPELEKTLYKEAAVKILKAIYEKRSDWTTNCDGIVQNCSESYHNEKGRHMTMVYGDFFFVEAMQKLNQIGELLW